jgi:RNA polymerase sigma-70 factor, ECF subfamily
LEIVSCYLSLLGGEGQNDGPPIPVNASDPRPIPSSVVRDDEPVLVAAAQRGDVAAFEELVTRYEKKIYRLTRNITGNQEDAEDAMQEAFLKSFEHLGSFKGESRFYTWLVRIAANEALMKLRRRHPREFSLDEVLPGDEDLMPRELDDWGLNPEECCQQAELQKILADAIENLESDFRIVFILRDVEELSTEETAKLLDLSISATKSRLLRARLKLRHRLNRFFRQGGTN